MVSFYSQRDKGAPLMCLDDNNVWRLHGVLSREGECQLKSHPDVFASVLAPKEWIENVVGFRQY